MDVPEIVTEETVISLVALLIAGTLIFVGLFVIARILMRDIRTRSVRIGFYMERDRDREDR